MKGLIEWPQTFLHEDVTVGDIERHLYQKRRKRKETSHKPASKGRHVKWSAEGYTQIRAGQPLDSVLEIDTLLQEDSMKEAHFFIFKRDDPLLGRNEDIPLYEAVYQCGGVFYRVQKKHLSRAYRKMGRCNKASMWTILEDGTPYWVDRYCISMMGQRDSKKRYEAKVKELKA